MEKVNSYICVVLSGIADVDADVVDLFAAFELLLAENCELREVRVEMRVAPRTRSPTRTRDIGTCNPDSNWTVSEAVSGY